MIGSNRLTVLAADIRSEHEAIRTGTVALAERAIEVGHKLIEAKTALAHGDWTPWLATHVGFSERTARRYMQLARSGLKPATVADLGLRAAVESLALAEDYKQARELVRAYAHGGLDAEADAILDPIQRLEFLFRVRDSDTPQLLSFIFERAALKEVMSPTSPA